MKIIGMVLSLLILFVFIHSPPGEGTQQEKIEQTQIQHVDIPGEVPGQNHSLNTLFNTQDRVNSIVDTYTQSLLVNDITLEAMRGSEEYNPEAAQRGHDGVLSYKKKGTYPLKGPIQDDSSSGPGATDTY